MKETIDIQSRVIDKCLQGDIKAQYQLYKQHSKAMYNIAIRFLDNKMDAEDILQESFCTAFRRLGELENPNAFPGWLKRIVINNCISLLRKKRLPFESIEEHKMEGEMNPEPDYMGEIDPALVHEAIRKLPDGSRTILVLYALEGYKHREVAEMLKVTESTSKTQYSRALALLRKELKDKINVN